MSIREEVLVGKIFYEYYLLPEKQQTNKKFLAIRRFHASYYYQNNQIKVNNFIHRFREIQDRMKICGIDGQTTMKFVFTHLALNECSKEISKKLDERDQLNLNPHSSLNSLQNKEEVREKPLDFLKRKFKKGLKRVKRKIYPNQYQLNLS